MVPSAATYIHFIKECNISNCYNDIKEELCHKKLFVYHLKHNLGDYTID